MRDSFKTAALAALLVVLAVVVAGMILRRLIFVVGVLALVALALRLAWGRGGD